MNMNIQKMLKNNKMNFNKNILHNKYLLYAIFFISVGNFFIELMKGNMYFVAVYILIGLLTSFFNKNMIVVLSLAAIFTNILNYGRATTYEGFDGDDSDDTEIEKILETDTSRDGEIIDEIVDGKKSKPKNNDSESEDEEDVIIKKEKKKNGLNKDTNNMDYEKTEKLLENQKQLLKNMKEYKPFLDTIQGITKNISGFVKDD
jgi:hypothetical protein